MVAPNPVTRFRRGSLVEWPTANTVYGMDAVQLIDIALANVDDRRFDVAAVEPADISIETVGGLVHIISGLARVAIAFSTGREVQVAGSWEHGAYTISISPLTTVGSSEMLDRMLEDPELPLGVATIARLSARHGLAVRLVAEGAGAMARITIPQGRAERVDAPALLTEAPSGEFVPHELERRVRVPADSARDESETFLESVFGALRNPWREPNRREPAVLQVRVPGESYSMSETDSPSTAPGEAAVDIRSALTTYDRGRRSAGLAADTVGPPRT